MMMSKVTFQQLKEVYKALSFDSDGASGSILIESDALKSSIKNLLLSEDNVNESGLNKKHPIEVDEIKIGDSIELTISPSRIGLGVLAHNIDILLGVTKARIKEPRQYYIVSEDYYSGDENPPDNILVYRSVLGFIELLKESALYLDQDKSELLFLYEGKFSIPIRYSRSDLLGLDLFYLDKIK
ncbi:hypothetical protein [Aeromonas allosaccharophila]|uniref:hypothetical protein n=1 Tax=Aeromonas allosaccharophila TaxID=656 RepID=UPI0039860247